MTSIPGQQVEMGVYPLCDLQASIRDLYSWYKRQEMMDVESLRSDEKVNMGANK